MSEEKGDAVRAYVDAKIEGMHDAKLPKVAYIGYYVDDKNQDTKPIGADESDDAEIQAILFAIDELRGRFTRLRVVCDHQSVVSEAKRESVRKPSPLLEKLRKTLRENPSVELEALETNPAHKVVTDYVNRLNQNHG